MSIRLNIVDRDGHDHTVEASPTGTLMEALRELEYGVAAVCGGMCSCATCHIHVAPEWLERLPDQQADERGLVAELQYRSSASRLACQIPLAEHLDGLRLTLAPEE
jgi:2Fe-2S ferredoxin